MPEIAKACNMRPDNGGGWLSGMLHGLNAYKSDLDITISFPFHGKKLEGQIKDIKYVSFC